MYFRIVQLFLSYKKFKNKSIKRCLHWFPWVTKLLWEKRKVNTNNNNSQRKFGLILEKKKMQTGDGHPDKHTFYFKNNKKAEWIQCGKSFNKKKEFYFAFINSKFTLMFIKGIVELIEDILERMSLVTRRCRHFWATASV